MKTSTFAALALATLSASALPTSKRSEPAIDDITVLNFALTLEHLEDAFYREGLSKFDDKAFTDAGLPAFARGRYQQIADHEKTHVAFLSSALGDKATKPCEYNFPYTDPKSFVALSKALEGVGASAYTGAAQLISNKDYLTAAASILATEGRHASWISSAVNRGNDGSGWSGSFDVPLGLNEVFTLASTFIKSCPSTNPALPVKAFPALTLDQAKPGATVTATFDAAAAGSSHVLYVAFHTGLDTKFVEIKDGKVAIPSDLVGTVYAVLTTSGENATGENVIAGPAILDFDFDSTGKVFD